MMVLVTRARVEQTTSSLWPQTSSMVARMMTISLIAGSFQCVQ